MELEVEIRRHSSQIPWTYAQLDRRQREVAAGIRLEGGQSPGARGPSGCLLLSELAPVITLGRRTDPTDLKLSASEFSQRGVEIYPTDRGGLATYHGPGQWVLFPVFALEQLVGDPRGIKSVIGKLLEVAAEVARVYQPVQIKEGCELGVWTPRGKVASVGVHVDQGVLLHGLSINGFATPLSFQGLRPCGLDAGVDYLLPKEDPEAFVRLGQAIVEAAQKTFGLPS